MYMSSSKKLPHHCNQCHAGVDIPLAFLLWSNAGGAASGLELWNQAFLIYLLYCQRQKHN